MRRAAIVLVASVLLLVPASQAQAAELPLFPLPIPGESDDLNSSEETSNREPADTSADPDDAPRDDGPREDDPREDDPREDDPSPADRESSGRNEKPADPEAQRGQRESPSSGEPAAERMPTGPPAEAEPGPGREWTLTASDLTLHGSRYHGQSEQEVDGQTVRTLRFTAEKLEVTDLVQRGALGNGRQLRVASAPGAKSTISGPVELEVRELSGTLSVAGFPLVPINLSPESVLPGDVDLSFLRLPKLSFNDVVVHNVELSADQLRIPGSRITLEGA